jgi:hypothetical protein
VRHARADRHKSVNVLARRAEPLAALVEKNQGLEGPLRSWV